MRGEVGADQAASLTEEGKEIGAADGMDRRQASR